MVSFAAHARKVGTHPAGAPSLGIMCSLWQARYRQGSEGAIRAHVCTRRVAGLARMM